MPLYDFHCPDCDKDVEVLARFCDIPACPTCGGTHMTRLVSRIAPEGKSKEKLKRARAQAGREGHFSNY